MTRGLFSFQRQALLKFYLAMENCLKEIENMLNNFVQIYSYLIFFSL